MQIKEQLSFRTYQKMIGRLVENEKHKKEKVKPKRCHQPWIRQQ